MKRYAWMLGILLVGCAPQNTYTYNSTFESTPTGRVYHSSVMDILSPTVKKPTQSNPEELSRLTALIDLKEIMGIPVGRAPVASNCDAMHSSEEVIEKNKEKIENEQDKNTDPEEEIDNTRYNTRYEYYVLSDQNMVSYLKQVQNDSMARGYTGITLRYLTEKDPETQFFFHSILYSFQYMGETDYNSVFVHVDKNFKSGKLDLCVVYDELK
ncbi:hypothetical protein [Deinococcus roseus]|uniref:Lipoprotein n=1 Tax=Deinococcus roseus TaxID=392414 RepID=A0ABQ2D3E7_9DEIO|nr:hypothetical protein [Deinococcus roseus]GGJ40035.1 hypothetical protein GCM10008938_27550 [Deinococcus roseus]